MALDFEIDLVLHKIDWMRKVDLHIFEILSYGDGLVMNGSSMGRNLDYHRSYLNQRCHELVDLGILEEEGRAYFKMSPEALEAWKEKDVERLNSLANYQEE